MADIEAVDEDSDFERQGSTERESLSTESSFDESPISPRSEDSDWSFGGNENVGLTNGYDPEKHRNDLINAEKKASIVDCLLFEIYDQYHSRDSVDSDNVTECSTTSGSFYGGSFDLEERGESWTRNELQGKGTLKHSGSLFCCIISLCTHRLNIAFVVHGNVPCFRCSGVRIGN